MRREDGGAKAKRHHVVPQAYLKAWADDHNRVRVFDGRTGRSFTTDTKNAAVRSKLYTLRLPDGSEWDDLEAMFAEVEGSLIEVIRSLHSGQWPLTAEGRSLIANFIALQIARAPSIPETTHRMIDEVTEMAEKMQAAMDSAKAEMSPDEYTEHVAAMSRVDTLSSGPSYTLDEFVEHHRYPTLGALAAMADFVEPIANLKFTLLESPEGEFLTSDQPVAHWAPSGQPEWRGTGLLTAEKSTLPISPHVCLQFQVPKDKDGERDAYCAVTRLEAALINSQTCRSASRHIVMRCDREYLGFQFPR